MSIKKYIAAVLIIMSSSSTAVWTTDKYQDQAISGTYNMGHSLMVDYSVLYSCHPQLLIYRKPGKAFTGYLTLRIVGVENTYRVKTTPLVKTMPEYEIQYTVFLNDQLEKLVMDSIMLNANDDDGAFISWSLSGSRAAMHKAKAHCLASM